MTTIESRFTELQEHYLGTPDVGTSMRQDSGSVQCALVYLHTNGEMEGFVAYGDTEQQAEERCIKRIAMRLRMFNGQSINMARVHGPEILNDTDESEVKYIEHDFNLSRSGNKF